MAEKPVLSPAPPSITIDAPAAAPQQEGISTGDEKQPQISGFTQEENSQTQKLNPPTMNPPNSSTPNNDKGPQISVGQNAPMVTPLHMLTENPTMIDCPFCRQRAMTRVTKEGTSTQTLAGVVLCLFCVCLACLPCVAGWCENVNIFCSSCSNRVATIPHDGPLMLAPVGR
ncbi:hypothetical protein GGR53DRAFT_512858 [Hypoxylon sp. FL1150]|nr:hypothetical protein GGR53DRAFT_512858 [Hypoxylon sp. FL1150]